jgi:hypothetical protein|tara:strand:- start:288 stop:1184 length:897 start_codon:yes stop_codon:yes gene_type:complete
MKNIDKKKLAKIIAEKVLNSKRKQNLKETVQKAVRRALLGEKVDAQDFPLKLSDVAADADQAKQNVSKGRQDGDAEDDVIEVTPNATFPVSQLKPSQTSMKISNAMGMALSMILGKMPTGGNLGGFISSDNHIMDGHHRWVATAMVDPSKEVGGYLVDFPGTDLIRLLNAITVGKLGINQGKEGSGSFDQFTEGPVKKELIRLTKEGSEFLKPEEVMQALQEFTGQEGQTAIPAAVKKFVANLGKLTFETPQGAPDRVDMPVIDPGKVPNADKIAAKALSQGEVDWNSPKAPSTLGEK